MEFSAKDIAKLVSGEIEGDETVLINDFSIISYLFSSGEETLLKDNEILSAQGSRLVETGIRTVYILGSIAILLMVFSTIRKSISK